MFAAAKRTGPVFTLALLFLAIVIVGPAGGAQRDRVRPTTPLNPHVTRATSTGVTIAWRASTDNLAVVGYEVYRGSSTRRETGTSHVLRDLACGTAIGVSVAAVDAAGNRSRRVSVIASTAACTDSTPPTAPTGFRQIATSEDGVVLVWQPSTDDVSVVSYGVYHELTRRSSTAEPTTTLTGLTCGSVDVVAVDAVDAAGNRSDRRLAYVETAACPSLEKVTVFGATAESDWVRCAPEGQQCAFAGTSEVRYGANGIWTSPRSFTDGVACTNKVFGDPIKGTVKSCEARSGGSTPLPPTTQGGSTPPLPPTTQWAHCAREGSTCSFVDAREVRYGANGRWTSPRTFTSGVACTNKVFGDPIYGVAKSCESRSLSSPPPTPSRDTTSPAKPLLSMGAVTGDRVTLNWQPGVDNVAVDHYAVWLNDSLVTRTASTSHVYTGLSCNTEYVLGLQVVDAAGNASTLAEARWPIRTTACSSSTGADSVPPTAPADLGITSATRTSVRLAWSPSTDNVGVAGYEAQKEQAYATTVTVPVATLGSLVCGTSYEFGVAAFDGADNWSPSTSVIGSTVACDDGQRPTAPTNLVATSRSATSIALSWTPSTDNLGVTGYGHYKAGTQVATSTAATAIFAGLTCNTNYTLGIDAFDAAGNRSTSTTVLVATTACADTTPPSVPTGLTAAGVTRASVNLGWTASSDNVGVAGYDVYRSGTKVASTTTTSASHSGLACGTSYVLGVEAIDAAGNRSARAQLSVSTIACAPAEPQPGSPSVAVSPTGSDTTCVRGDLTRPCQTFDRAYQLASCGDVVSIRSGSYAEQILRERAACSSPITLNAEQGAVTQRVWFGTCQGCYSADAPDDLVLRGLKTAGVIMWGDVEDVTLDRIDGGSFFIRGGVRITVRGSDWGPCPSPASGSSANQCLGYFGPQQSRISYQSNPSDTSNLLIEGNTFHDHPAVSPDHWECLWTNGATNVTFRGNIVYGCQNTGSFWLEPGTRTGLAGTWIFENNWFLDGGSAIGIGAVPLQNGRVIIRFNSFGPGAGVLKHDSSSDTGTVRIVGNILGRANCFSGGSVSHNVYIGQACAGQGNVSMASAPYTNASNGPSANYRLVGATGSTAADNLVPGSASDGALGFDYDGQTRSEPRDAGADDR